MFFSEQYPDNALRLLFITKIQGRIDTENVSLLSILLTSTLRNIFLRVLFYYQNLGAMMPDSNNYAKESDPMSAIQVQLTVMSTRLEDVQQTMHEVGKLPMQVEKLNIAVEQFQRDHETTKASLKATQTEVSDLNKAHTRIDTIKNIVQFGGIATMCAIGGAWLALSDKADTANAKSTMNEQRIVVLEKNQDQLMRIQDDMRMRLYQRESTPPTIISPRGQNEAY